MDLARRLAAVFLATFVLVACGGGGGGPATDPDPDNPPVMPPVTPVPPVDPGENTDPTVGTYTPLSTVTVASSALNYLALDDGSRTQSGVAGTLDHSDGTITGGLAAGTLSADRSRIVLDGGGQILLANLSETEYVLVFATESYVPALRGVAGRLTDAADLPAPDAGETVFGGRVQMQVATETEVFVLTGDAILTADWSGGQVTSEFVNMAGTGNGNIRYNDAGQLTLALAPISGGTFAGGTASGSGTAFATVDAGANTSGTLGAFFGPNADEVGGVVAITGTNLQINGVYTAE